MLIETPVFLGLIFVALAMLILRVAFVVQRIKPESASSLITGRSLVSESRRIGGGAASGAKLQPRPLPWSYCALSLLGASTLLYGGAYFAIERIL